MVFGMAVGRRAISTFPGLCQRIKQTEREIVKMFLVQTPRDDSPMSSLNQNSSTRTLDERFIRILKIFKWGPDAEKALEVLKLKVDHRLVREVLKIEVDINVKVHFFKWAGKRRNFEHVSMTYMSLIRCLLEAGSYGELWKTIQDFVRSPSAIRPSEFSKGDPIEERYKEHMERGGVAQQLVDCVTSFREAAISADSKFDHIELPEKEKVLNACGDAEAWLREKQQQQDALPKYATPLLRSADIMKKADEVTRLCRPIMTKPKPAPPKPATPEPQQPQGSEPQSPGGDSNVNASASETNEGPNPEPMDTEEPEPAPGAA